MEQTPSRPKRKPRRWRSRIMLVLGYVVAALLLAWFFQERPTTTVIFVRHADVDAGTTDPDPPLNARGRQRAELLADFLQSADVVGGVNNIYAAADKRTQETAAPLAKRLGLTPHIDDPHRIERLIHRILRDRSGDIVLVVSYADTIAPLIAELHGSKRVPPIADDDYDELYIVTSPNFGRVKTLRFHYPEPPPEAELPHAELSESDGGAR
ncbi:MAG TPA: phosphoglycerate mutase family protein [Gammaproteobacteria bacterium]|nr:phosphoglycerate mutase family protein [Gammaproteobacteria bacterium]